VLGGPTITQAARKQGVAAEERTACRRRGNKENARNFTTRIEVSQQETRPNSQERSFPYGLNCLFFPRKTGEICRTAAIKQGGEFLRAGRMLAQNLKSSCENVQICGAELLLFPLLNRLEFAGREAVNEISVCPQHHSVLRNSSRRSAGPAA